MILDGGIVRNSKDDAEDKNRNYLPVGPGRDNVLREKTDEGVEKIRDLLRLICLCCVIKALAKV